MPKKPRTTSDPIGQKLLQVLREKQIPDDLNALAAAFGVQVQSTYDWINHGRIAKDRYRRLVEWSGKSLHWWFDVPTPAGEVAAIPAREEGPGYSLWPLPGITPAEFFEELSPELQNRVAGFAAGLLAAHRDSQPANGRRALA